MCLIPQILLLVAPALVADSSLPEPSGPHGVGTVEFHWVDEARPEPATQDPADRRELMLQIWYPAQRDVAHERAPYLPYLEHYRSLFDETEWPHLVQMYGKVRVNGRLGAEVADSLPSYPVLIFSPGLGNSRSDYTVQAEELASRGYIVVVVDHTFVSNLLAFPDGRIVRQEPAWSAVMDGSPEAKQLRVERSASCAQDVSFIVDQLEKLRDGTLDDKRFIGRLDLSRLAALGHSFGGSVAIEAARNDPRIRACANEDGSIWGPAKTSGVDAPLLLIDDGPPDVSDEQLLEWGRSREEWLALYSSNSLRDAAICGLGRSGGTHVVLRDLYSHSLFTDEHVLFGFDEEARYGVKQRTFDPVAALLRVTDVVDTFFRQHLDDDPAARMGETLGEHHGTEWRVYPPLKLVETPSLHGVPALAQDGRLFLAGQPSEEGLRAAHAEGVVAVVNLMRTGEVAEEVRASKEAFILSLGMTYVHIPFTADTFSMEHLGSFIEVLHGTEGSVLVFGEGAQRAAALWAAYLVHERGFAVDAAIERAMRLGLRAEALIESAQRMAGIESEAR